MSIPAKTQREHAFLASVDPARRRFPNALRVGDTIYLSSEPPVGDNQPASTGDIQDQTRLAFTDFEGLLHAVGARMSDLVKLHTFYVFEGDDCDATVYWERMTEIRLRYFANPGPAGTALRVKGAPSRDRLIAIDGVASRSAERTRLMPAHAWDWSVPTPLSQGWRVGNVVYAGGQISADRRGRAVAAGDVAQQTVNTMEYLRHVLLEAGAGFEHIAALKIGYQHRGDDVAARAVLDEILGIVQPLLDPARCVLTCLGVDLLYEGLVLEIDAMATLGNPAKRTTTGVGAGWSGASGFAAACRVHDTVCVGAISAPGEALLDAQVRVSLERLDAALRALGSRVDDLAKLNVLFTGDRSSEIADATAIAQVLDASLPAPGPVVTLVRVAGLPRRGQRVQLDAVAACDAD